MASFLGLSLTGLPLLFADARWAAPMAGLVGGYGVTGVLHRMFATLLIAVFVAHVGRVLHKLYVRRDLGILWGPDSLVPQPRDVVQMAQHFRYFVGLGPRPAGRGAGQVFFFFMYPSCSLSQPRLRYWGANDFTRSGRTVDRARPNATPNT